MADFNQALSSCSDSISSNQIEFIISRLQSSIMTDEERALPKLTR